MADVTHFSDQHVPARAPAGPVIPTGVRDALLGWFSERGITPTAIRRRLALLHGYGRPQDVVEDVLERWGKDEALECIESVEKDVGLSRFTGEEADDRPILRHVPAPLFLDALECGIELLRENPRTHSDGVIVYIDHQERDAVAEINRLFEKRGIHYRFTEEGKAEWHGDAGGYEQLIAPALAALTDPRLAGCRSEFEAALDNLRKGTGKDMEDAVEEAGKAVESAMKVLLDEKGIPRTGKETAWPLWEKLRDNGVVVPEADNLVLAAARLRNEYGAHGTGPSVRSVPPGVPEAAVNGAAAAINYLAGLLP